LNLPEREGADLDRDLGLRAGRDLKEAAGAQADLYTLLQILSVHIFDRTELRQALSGSGRTSGELPIANQLQLFNF
jgi:hypothetical protein